jgi:hypothetical protein
MIELTPSTAALSSNHTISANVGGGLDCNGYSPISPNVKQFMICADPAGHNGQRFYDNGWYVGHDEPAINFFSNAPDSANNVQWLITLPQKGPTPTQNGRSVSNFELYPAFWFSMALCDPRSYPQNPCIPDSDKNTGIGLATDAGEAFLEMQFYPPGWSPFINRVSCDQVHWCAALNIDSLECNFGYAFCNSNCVEPVNFAFIQTNGVPTGPPGPGDQTTKTFTPNDHTLLMNPGDSIEVKIKDSPGGLLVVVIDLTSGNSGYMVASAANGFQNTALRSCKTFPFSFRPEYDTATPTPNTFWGAVPQNIAFSYEIGHFELGASGDHDADDAPCFPGPVIAGCLTFTNLGGDLDFDGQPYLADWPNGNANYPQSVVLFSPQSFGSGSTSLYSKIRFSTTVAASESTCNLTTGKGCTVPPRNSMFYPFYSQAGRGPDCTFVFGNVIPGVSVNSFGKDHQYLGTFTSLGGLEGPVMENSCAGL